MPYNESSKTGEGVDHRNNTTVSWPGQFRVAIPLSSIQVTPADGFAAPFARGNGSPVSMLCLHVPVERRQSVWAREQAEPLWRKLSACRAGTCVDACPPQQQGIRVKKMARIKAFSARKRQANCQVQRRKQSRSSPMKSLKSLILIHLTGNHATPPQAQRTKKRPYICHSLPFSAKTPPKS